MGGFGSGGHNRQRHCIDDYRRLDVLYLQRHKALRNGTQSIIRWSSSNRCDASIGVISDGSSVKLRYKTQVEPETAWTMIEDSFALVGVAKPFGGAQVYFSCRLCKRRSRFLYLKRGRFACRVCHDLVHKTQQAAKGERPMLKSQTLRERLGGLLGIEDPVVRPKGMHRRTYERYQARIHAAECEVWDEAAGLLKRLYAFDERGGFWSDKERFWG